MVLSIESAGLSLCQLLALWALGELLAFWQPQVPRL
jgi:hypothetical protein